MATGDESATGLADLASAASRASSRGLPPVHLWNPPHCGEIDIVIRRDGVWLHEGSPIRRPELVRLFSTVLRKDPEGYCLVTPVEKLSIRVDDLPFRAVSLARGGGRLVFTTDVGDEVVAGPDHPLEIPVDPATGEPAPRLRVRQDLWARVARPIYYELVGLGEIEDGDLVVRSNGSRFLLGRLEAHQE